MTGPVMAARSEITLTEALVGLRSYISRPSVDGQFTEHNRSCVCSLLFVSAHRPAAESVLQNDTLVYNTSNSYSKLSDNS